MIDFTITNADVYFGIIINAICTGIGVAIGTTIAQKHIIKKVGKIARKMRIK